MVGRLRCRVRRERGMELVDGLMPRTIRELTVSLLTFTLVICLLSLLALILFPLRTVLSIALPALLLG